MLKIIVTEIAGIKKIFKIMTRISEIVYMEGGRSYKAEQLFFGFTCRNLCPRCAQVEKKLKMAVDWRARVRKIQFGPFCSRY